MIPNYDQEIEKQLHPENFEETNIEEEMTPEEEFEEEFGGQWADRI
jgi:hypothetical protein